MINKETRIKNRAEQYAKGEITLKDFYMLESLSLEEDGETEETATLEQARNSVEPVAVVRPVFTPSKPKSKEFNMNKEEFNKLQIHDQQRLYEQFPEEVEELLEDSLEEFNGRQIF